CARDRWDGPLDYW
nr:immunoglobulin heavy chain junction region [Mus musculus]